MPLEPYDREEGYRLVMTRESANPNRLADNPYETNA